MTSWREAKSLLTLLDEYNACFPHRSKASDGMVGDASHQSRDSDHNPWIVDRPGPNVVSAIDLTRDVAPGIPDTAQWLVDVLVASRDPRIKYLIHNHRMWRSYAHDGIPAWSPAPYNVPGIDPHEHHTHVSVNATKSLYDSNRPWGLAAALAGKPNSKDDAAMNELVATCKRLGITPVKGARLLLRYATGRRGPLQNARIVSARTTLSGME